jgi:hypothetical protein
MTGFDCQKPSEALPVTDSAGIENGPYCVGGFVGDMVQAPIAFAATSPFGKIQLDMLNRKEHYRCF